MGFGVWGLGFGVWGLGFGVQSSGFRVQVSGFRVQVSGFGVQGSGFCVEFVPFLQVLSMAAKNQEQVQVFRAGTNNRNGDKSRPFPHRSYYYIQQRLHPTQMLLFSRGS